jgi:hypothetical protein
MDALAQRAEREIADLHHFFEDWFCGRVEQTREHFARFAEVTAEEFHLISPSGVMIDRAQALAWIWEMHGARPTTRMGVDKVRVVSRRAGYCVAVYEEWQETPDTRTVRLSSALLDENTDAPNGLRWLHVHETWI